ncbi:class I SAM-dependent methyltransferase [Corynebacterium sp. A21]|uniref:class I SAM-dependent methyltransferase n=1 Tax=Corynebacterium sp. A21 TaxID=3457318 RepID=UPI003FD29F69
MNSSHLHGIDTDRWPGVANVPSGPLMRLRARHAESLFAKLCEKAELSLDPANSPDLIVDHEELFSRLADSGWLGLAESYLAGEWRSGALREVLVKLLGAGYKAGRRARKPEFDHYEGGELPPELVRLNSADGMSIFGAVFSAPATTERTAVISYVPGAGRNREPASHFVDVTTLADPTLVEREDLTGAQQRAVEMLLDAAEIGPGTHLLELPSAGGAVPVAAAHRRATVDSLTADPDHFAALQEQLTLAGVDDFVHTDQISGAVPQPKEWRGRYDAIISVESLEGLSRADRPAFAAALDRLLIPGGRVTLQTVVATDSMTPAVRESLGLLRAYIWPGLEHPTITEVHQLFDRHSGLRVISQTHLGTHYAKTLELQHQLFLGQQREAAADGFDIVFRRMWQFQYALREALFELGHLDAVQFTLTSRNRRGQR